MTRATVYEGQPWEDDNEVLADLFLDHEQLRGVTVKAANGQEIQFDSDEWVDIYISGTPVGEDE